MRMLICACLSLLGFMADAALAAEPCPDRLVWVFGFDLENGKDVAEVETLLDTAAAHGLNGAVLSAGLDGLAKRSPEFMAGLERVRKSADKNKLELIPAIFSFGYGGCFLSQNRNLAEGLPVRDALFVAGEDGTARLVADPAVEVVNGGFEEFEGNNMKGYGFHDAPGVISFPDARVSHSGKASLRLENFASDKWGHGRASQKVKVHPYRSYRVTLWVKAEGLKPKQCFNLFALAPKKEETSLSQRTFDLSGTTEWQKLVYVFNSREFKEVNLYAGVWEGKEGRLWLDDLNIEELGPMNVLRRPGTPVRVAPDKGKTVYKEGKDYAKLEDPEFNPYRDNHDAPALKLIEGGRIKPGARLRVSWYHPMMVYQSQVTVCMAEPEIYRIADAAMKTLWETLRPNRVNFDVDEIRMGGTCKACGGRNMGELLGQSVTKLVRIARKYNPKMKISLWSDMFDPNHNARGNYYHVKGSYAGSWNHVPKDLIMSIWGSEPNPKSLKFFRDKGFKVIGSCYYDADNLDGVKQWLAATRGMKNVRGFMYTPWERKYALLPGFGDLLQVGQ
jgi:hypothetical protein